MLSGVNPQVVVVLYIDSVPNIHDDAAPKLLLWFGSHVGRNSWVDRYALAAVMHELVGRLQEGAQQVVYASLLRRSELRHVLLA